MGMAEQETAVSQAGAGPSLSPASPPLPLPHSQVRGGGVLSADVPQVRGLPPRRGPAALPAELPLRRLLLLGRPGLPVQRRGQLRRRLCPQGGARRLAGAQLLWWAPSLPATPSPKPSRICGRMPSPSMHVAFALLCLHSCLPNRAPGHLTGRASGNSSWAPALPSHLPAGPGGRGLAHS